MIVNYKTGKLPFNFIALGVLLFATGIWRMAVMDWAGILYFLVSLLFLFTKSGILIDTDLKRLKKYIGFFIIKMGTWEDIRSLINLRVIETRESQIMNVLSISRTETSDICKLFMTLPERNIEIMTGKKDYIQQRAEKISGLLQTPVIDNTL